MKRYAVIRVQVGVPSNIQQYSEHELNDAIAYVKAEMKRDDLDYIKRNDRLLWEDRYISDFYICIFDLENQHIVNYDD